MTLEGMLPALRSLTEEVKEAENHALSGHRHIFWQISLAYRLPTRMTLQGGSDVIVISRTKNEGIVLGNGIILTVIEIRGDKVRLAVELPKGATLHQREVHEAIVSQKVSGREE
jgi:carbon storage regulator